ncbi:MAG TPA: class I SAM-dependent methyltransferase, partial [Bacillales bacterium]
MQRPHQIIPFYGGENPRLFEIERRCMDREGKVIDFLDQWLPAGAVLDIGAGNGYTAEKLSREDRFVVAMEPDEKMIDRTKDLLWSRGIAQDIPFHTNSFQAAYATWAFFLDGVGDIDEGLREMERVVKDGGQMIIVDNYGHDEFCSYSPHNISSDVS